MKVIGIIGGIASGKSRVAAEILRRGARLIDADRIGHDLLETEPVKQAVRARWGNGVFRDGQIARPLLARAVFDVPGSEELDALNRILHPEITARVGEELAACRSRGDRLVLLDAPLLCETGLDRLCDEIIFVDTDLSLRQERAAERAWSADELLRREARQIPLEEKRARADLVIDNNGPVEMIAPQIDSFLRRHNA
ncbi:MAG: dephospho-CoA kinase [Thermoguttaceae bacterium]|nr:dephospho-CoA kinase [Thermoguttaceae bacterium]